MLKSLRLPLLFSILCAPLFAMDLFVAPNGNDAWSGTQAEPASNGNDGPLATLLAARDRLRKARAAGDSGPHTVTVRGGIYELQSPVLLEEQDSGSPQHPVLWKAYADESPILSGSVRLKDWEVWKGEIVRARFKDHRNVAGGIRQVLLDGKRQVLARYPNFDANDPVAGGWAFAGGEGWPMYADKPGEDKRTLEVREADWRKWAKPEEVELFVFPRFNWWNDRVRVKSLDAAARKVTLVKDCSYAIRLYDRYFFQNALEELDAPGEWYFDKTEEWLYFWPPAGKSASAASVVVARNLLRMEKGTHDVVWRGFTMEGSNESAALLLGTERCAIEKNRIRSVGDWSGHGVMVSGGTQNAVRRNSISGVGNCGIQITGGSLETLTPSNNVAEDNELSDFGVFFKQGLGVNLYGVGNRALHNHIHHGPRFGIGHSGSMNEVGFNHIHDVCLETEDTGAIYSNGRDWFTARGTRIHHNYIHDIPGFTMWEGKPKTPNFAWGIYLDDATGGADVFGNIVVRCGRGGMHGHGARDSHVSNNIFMDNHDWQVDFHGWLTSFHFWLKHGPLMTESFERIAGRPEWAHIRGSSLHPKDFPLPGGLLMAGNRFERNIVVSVNPETPVLDVKRAPFDKNYFDQNLYWASGGEIRTNFQSAGPDQGENMIGAFSGSAGRMPDGWGWSVKTKECSAVLKDAAGERVLELSGAGSETKAMVAVGPRLGLECGETYRLRARLRAGKAGEAEVGVHCYAPKRPFWTSPDMRRKVGSEWAEYEWVFMVPGVGKAGWHDAMKDFNVRVSWKGAAGTLEVADLRLHKASQKSGWEAWQAAGPDANSLVADPGFEDLATFRLGKDSPAWKLGFEPIPFEQIGPRPER